MKRYLNSQEKKTVSIASAIFNFYEQLLAHSKALPKEAVTELKHAKTRTIKAREIIKDKVDPATRRFMENLVRDQTIGILSAKDSKEFRAEELRYFGGSEHVATFAEVVMETKCKSCDGTCRDSCPFYEGLVHFQMPEWDENDPYCPYAHAGETA